MTIDDIGWLGDDYRAWMRDLLATDIEQNLDVRMQVFSTADPEWAERRFDVVKVLQAQRGTDKPWAVCGFEEGLVYTLGLYYRFQLPEIMIVDRRKSDSALARIVNEVAARAVQGEPPEPGAPMTTSVGELTFTGYEPAMFSRYPCGFLYTFYRFFADDPYDDPDRDPPVLIAVANDSDDARYAPLTVRLARGVGLA